MYDINLEVAKELVKTAIADVNFFYMTGQLTYDSYVAILKDLSAIQDRLFNVGTHQ